MKKKLFLIEKCSSNQNCQERKFVVERIRSIHLYINLKTIDTLETDEVDQK